MSFFALFASSPGQNPLSTHKKYQLKRKHRVQALIGPLSLYPQAGKLNLIRDIDDAGPTVVALNRFKVVDLERGRRIIIHDTTRLSLSLSLFLSGRKETRCTTYTMGISYSTVC